MPQKKHKPEEIAAKLRQVDVLVSQGQSVAEAVRSIGVTQFTYYRWRKAAHLGDPVQFAGDTDAGDRCVHDRRQAFPAEVVDHAQNAEPAGVRQRVRHEVQRPSLVWSLRDTGHAHLYVDGLKTARLYGPHFHLPDLTPGQREIVIALSSNDHSFYFADALRNRYTQWHVKPGESSVSQEAAQVSRRGRHWAANGGRKRAQSRRATRALDSDTRGAGQVGT